MTEADIDSAIAEDVRFGSEVLADRVHAVQCGVRHLWELKSNGRRYEREWQEEESVERKTALAQMYRYLADKPSWL